MNTLIIWTLIWYVIWALFNAKIRWWSEKFKSRKYISRGLFFFLSFIVAYTVYYPQLSPVANQFMIGVLVANTIGLFLGSANWFYKKFIKDRFFLLFQTFNILFQQAMIVAGVILLKEIMAGSFKDYLFGIFFMGIHIPLLFLPWAKLKYPLVISCFFAGWLFSYLILNFSYGIVVTFTIHFTLYVWEIFYTKDEEKI